MFLPEQFHGMPKFSKAGGFGLPAENLMMQLFMTADLWKSGNTIKKAVIQPTPNFCPAAG